MRAAIIVMLLLAAPVASAEPSARDVAKRHFTEASEHFRAGEYEAAMTSYSLAYDLLPMPAFLFNLGQCHRKLGQRAEALDYFRDYLAAEPDAPNRADVEALIDELEAPPAPMETDPNASKPAPGARARHDGAEGADVPAPMGPETRRLAEVPTEPPPPPELVAVAPPAPDDETPLHGKWWFWALVGGAAAAAAGSAAVAVAANSSSEPSPLPARPLGALHVD